MGVKYIMIVGTTSVECPLRVEESYRTYDTYYVVCTCT